jgi:NAD(P)-dependent dehydrogenase (short-subunit alcohol dehydrogenase family)
MTPTNTDPVAVVTGAGRGIGRAVAQRLSASGYRVALTARSKDELDETASGCTGETLVVPADLVEPTAVDDVFQTVEGTWDTADVVIANAGAAVSGRVQTITDTDWQRTLDLNLTAPFRCMRRALPAMIERRAGRVVVVASVASKVGEPYLAAYTASKHGVLGLVRSAAAEVAGMGVTVNAVCPGYVDTPMTDASVAMIVGRTGWDADRARAYLAGKQPTGRLVTPDEVADGVMFCVGNGSVNGQGVNIDGGAVQS